MIQSGIADHKKGDTWDGIEIIATEDNIPIDLTGASILAQFKTRNFTVFSFKTDDGSITVPNPTDGKMYFMEKIIDAPANTYYFDVEVIFPDGQVLTITPTLSWKITQDISWK